MNWEIPHYSFFVTFLILTGIMIIRYFAMGFGFLLLCRNRTPIEAKRPEGKHISRDIIWSVVSSLVFALNGAVLIYLWKEGYSKLETGMISLVHLFNLILYFVIHDAYFYITHRLFHKKSLFSYHKVHHLSRIPTAWTSFSFHPVEAIVQALIIPVLVLLFPIHWTLFVFFLTTMSVLGFLNHLGYELYPAFLEKKLGLISASHHQHHHRDVNSNYGLYFTWWDKWLETEAEGRHGR